MAVETKQDFAYRFLKEKIAEGVLLPGQRIIVSRIAKEIGTSVIPIREALVRLEAERLIDSKPHIGAVVALATKTMVLDTLEGLAVLEGYATQLAWDNAGKVVPSLRETNDLMSKAFHAKDWEGFTRHNRAFHLAITEASGNEALIHTINGLLRQLDSYLSGAAFNLMPDRAGSSIEEHERIIELLLAAEPDREELERTARQHKLATVERLARVHESD